MADRDTLRQLKDQIDDLSSQIDDLEFTLEETKDSIFDEHQAKQLFEIYKRDLIRQNLWNDQLEEHLELFYRFDLNPALDSL